MRALTRHHKRRLGLVARFAVMIEGGGGQGGGADTDKEDGHRREYHDAVQKVDGSDNAAAVAAAATGPGPGPSSATKTCPPLEPEPGFLPRWLGQVGARLDQEVRLYEMKAQRQTKSIALLRKAMAALEEDSYLGSYLPTD